MSPIHTLARKGRLGPSFIFLSKLLSWPPFYDSQLRHFGPTEAPLSRTERFYIIYLYGHLLFKGKVSGEGNSRVITVQFGIWFLIWSTGDLTSRFCLHYNVTMANSLYKGVPLSASPVLSLEHHGRPGRWVVRPREMKPPAPGPGRASSRARAEPKTRQQRTSLHKTSLHAWATWRRKQAGGILDILSKCQVEARALLQITHQV